MHNTNAHTNPLWQLGKKNTRSEYKKTSSKDGRKKENQLKMTVPNPLAIKIETKLEWRQEGGPVT